MFICSSGLPGMSRASTSQAGIPSLSSEHLSLAAADPGHMFNHTHMFPWLLQQNLLLQQRNMGFPIKQQNHQLLNMADKVKLNNSGTESMENLEHF